MSTSSDIVAKRLDHHSENVAALRSALLDWYKRDGRQDLPWRRRAATRYEQVVSEVLLQRTRAQTVAEFFPTFIRRYSNWKKLASASEAELQDLLQPLGLSRRRAAVLRSLGEVMLRRRGRFPKDRKGVETLPGVGQYVASAVLMFCHGQREPLLDGNMARVLERVFEPRHLVDIRYDPWLQALSRKLVDSDQPQTVNWAVLDFAAQVCESRRPKCKSCSVRELCRVGKNSCYI